MGDSANERSIPMLTKKTQQARQVGRGLWG